MKYSAALISWDNKNKVRTNFPIFQKTIGNEFLSVKQG